MRSLNVAGVATIFSRELLLRCLLMNVNKRQCDSAEIKNKTIISECLDGLWSSSFDKGLASMCKSMPACLFVSNCLGRCG